MPCMLTYTNAYVSIQTHAAVSMRLYADVCIRMLTSAYVCVDDAAAAAQRAYAAAAAVGQAYVSLRQHTSA